jgi:ElaB/YqjD/DUF883 family membrane-anchored ribosome-binding protein
MSNPLRSSTMMNTEELADELKSLGERAAQTGEKGLHAAKRSAKQVARASEAFVKDHPAVAAGALVGVGVLVGAVAHRALRREPSLGEVLGRELARRAKEVSKAVASASRHGAKLASKRLRAAVV